MPPLATQVAQAPDGFVVAAQALYYAGIAGLLGAAVAGVVFERTPRRVARTTPLAWLMAAGAALAIHEYRRRALGADLSMFLSTSSGRASVVRAAGLMVAYGGVIAAARSRGWGTRLLAAGASVAAIGHALGGHASDGTLPVLQQSAHIVAAGAWIGGLGALLLGIRGEPGAAKARAVKRFSTIAAVALFTVGATGVVRAAQELGSARALVETTYGRLVVFKFQILVALAILGSLNRLRHVQEAGARLRGLRRAGSAEVAIALVAFATTGVLSGTAPGREALALEASSRRPVVSTFEQDGLALVTVTFPSGATLQSYADPGRAGDNEVHITYFDAAGNEARAEAVTLTAIRAGARVQATLRRLSPGHFVAALRLGAGTWTFESSARASGERLRASFAVPIRA